MKTRKRHSSLDLSAFVVLPRTFHPFRCIRARKCHCSGILRLLRTKEIFCILFSPFLLGRSPTKRRDSLFFLRSVTTHALLCYPNTPHRMLLPDVTVILPGSYPAESRRKHCRAVRLPRCRTDPGDRCRQSR